MENNPIEFDVVNLPGRAGEVSGMNLRADSANGISVSVSVSNVSSEEDGVAIALNEVETILDELAFERRMAIGRPRLSSQAFEDESRSPATQSISSGVTLHLSCNATTLTRASAQTIEKQIMNSAPAASIHKQMFRSAIRSNGSVERFMHFYNLLMMLHGDHQGRVDAFIRQHETDVSESQSPHHKAGVMETVYTRLRNEISHHRQGVDLEETKRSMSDHVGRLLEHVRDAIVADGQKTPSVQ
ncbi:hypothetical protein [Rubripirellula obstinata]|uniref:hypothetical protein n=1 Tax=Rubripirellula obstinata TaxID=406547 RepID=UPI001359A4D5|nr:hypothetical protein [Rubripirellula obstinata]